MSPTLLNTLLAQNRRFKPTYAKGKLANHLAMALIALDRLGASAERLQAFYTHYSTRLEIQKSPDHLQLITADNWQQYLGRADHYTAYLAYFTQALHSHDIGTVLKQHLPSLIPGLSGQAFHGMIRLAYAVEIQDSEELAVALAYFASTCLFLPETTSGSLTCSTFQEALAKIKQLFLTHTQPIIGETIVDRLKIVAEQPTFATLAHWLPVSVMDLNTLAKLALHLYVTTDDFSALHLLTTAHALRILQPYLENQQVNLRYYWQAFCAVYISIGCPTLLTTELLAKKGQQMGITWPTLHAQTVKTMDDHTIKLVYSSYQEDLIYQNTLYRYVAARKLGSLYSVY